MAEKKQSKRNGGPTGGGGGGAGGAGSGTGGPMDVGLLEQLVKLMAANDLNTVDLRDGDKRVVLQRGQAVAAAAAYMPYPAAPQHAPPPAAPSGGGGASTASSAGEDAGLVSIKSEMVGTFYSKPSPDAKPFVGVGSDVDEDTVVCVIEAMKHFNPVKADVRGTIAKVLVTDGQTVDVGKPLFLVRPG